MRQGPTSPVACLSASALAVAFALAGSCSDEPSNDRLPVSDAGDDALDSVDQPDTDTEETDPGPLCGDGVVDHGEGCDDNNEVDDDDCSNDCIVNFCGVCDSNADCGEGNLCLALEDGLFCGRDCADDSTPCPDGAECIELTDDGGTSLGVQCMPATGYCGECPDSDEDGICDGDDRCSDGDDEDDEDGDGVPDACDVCRDGDDGDDEDADGLPDDCDPCPGVASGNDEDGDCVADGSDVCPGFADAIDTDDDAMPDGCDECIDPEGDGECVTTIVRVTYDGPLTLTHVEVLLFDSERACSTLTQDPMANPSPDTPWSTLVLLPDIEERIPERGLRVPYGVAFQYAVARGQAASADGERTGFFATFGCLDVVPAPDIASAEVIEIDMHNLWPSVGGTYQITNQIDLPTLLPGDVESLLGPVGEMFMSPGIALLRLMAVSMGGALYWDPDACAADTGSYCDTWHLLFECSGDNPSTDECDGEVLPTDWGLAASAAVEAMLDAGIEASPDAAGDTFAEVLAAGAAVFENAEELVVGGNLVITDESDPAGVLGTANSVTLNRITWKWIDFDNPGVVVERSGQLRNEAFVRGTNIGAALVFNVGAGERVSYEQAYSLRIDPFDLSLDYGELLTFVLEGILFPTFIGFEVDSFEDLFAELFDCQLLGSDVAVATDSDVGEAVEASCEALRTTAVAALVDWSISMTPELSTEYHLGTPADDPCSAAFAPEGSDFEIRALGAADLPDRCHWEGEIRYDSDGAPVAMDGSWWGEKL